MWLSRKIAISHIWLSLSLKKWHLMIGVNVYEKNPRKNNHQEAFRFMCQSGYFCLLGSFVSENPYLDFISMEWHTNTYMGSILSPICIICSI